MDKKFIEKCEEIFEEKKYCKLDESVIRKNEEEMGFEFDDYMLFLLENYEDVFIKENYGFKSYERTPFADENGFEVLSTFYGLTKETNLLSIYETYKEQLPIGVIAVAEMDGGNQLCINKKGSVYIWLHDSNNDNSLYLASKNLKEFILGVEEIPKAINKIDLNDITSNYSDDFWS